MDPYSASLIDDSSMWAIIAAFSSVIIIVGLAAYVLNAIFMMKLFAKANVPAWKAWVPFVNSWKFLELGGFAGGWIFINLVPGVGSLAYVVISCIAAYNIGLKLQKEGIWVLLYVVVSIVWMALCGLDKSVWDDNLGQPARGPEVPPRRGGGVYSNLA
jgi:hypothetical protein